MADTTPPVEDLVKTESTKTPSPEMATSPSPKKKFPWLPTILATLFLIISAVLGYQYYQLKKQTQQPIPTTPPAEETTTPPSLTPQESYSEDTDIPNQKKYTSPKLGISFLYLSLDPYGNDLVNVKEIGNKIYVYAGTQSYQSGQYVEVFDKDPSFSLKQALETTFLEDYSPDNCIAFVQDSSGNYPTSYTEAIIKIPGEFTTMEEMSEKVSLCPRPYTAFGGIAYFLMDDDHSDKFVFFSIGQYALSADENIAWQDTLQFID